MKNKLTYIVACLTLILTVNCDQTLIAEFDSTPMVDPSAKVADPDMDSNGDPDSVQISDVGSSDVPSDSPDPIAGMPDTPTVPTNDPNSASTPNDNSDTTMETDPPITLSEDPTEPNETGAGSPQDSSCITFLDIAAAAPAFVRFDEDLHYLGEFIIQHPSTCFFEIDSSNTCIKARPTPSITGSTTQITPTGGDDTARVLDALNAAGAGGAVDGDGATFRLRNATISTAGVRLQNMNIIPNTSSGSYLIRINADDVMLDGVHIDAQDNDYTEGLVIHDGADRAVIVNSSVRNIKTSSAITHSLLRVRSAERPYIACNTLEGIGGPSVRGLRFGHADTETVNDGAYVINNDFGRNRSTAKECDAIYCSGVHGPDDGWISEPLKIIANRSVNAGRRFLKGQASNIKAFSNTNEWSGNEGQPQARLSMYSSQGWNRHWYQNNRVIFAHTDSWRGRAFMLSGGYDRGTTSDFDDLHVDNNHLRVITTPGSTGDGFVDIVNGTNDTIDGPWPTNSSVDNNVVDGPGEVSYFMWFRGSSASANQWSPAGSPTRDGNDLSSSTAPNFYK